MHFVSSGRSPYLSNSITFTMIRFSRGHCIIIWQFRHECIHIIPTIAKPCLHLAPSLVSSLVSTLHIDKGIKSAYLLLNCYWYVVTWTGSTVAQLLPMRVSSCYQYCKVLSKNRRVITNSVLQCEAQLPTKSPIAKLQYPR